MRGGHAGQDRRRDRWGKAVGLGPPPRLLALPRHFGAGRRAIGLLLPVTLPHEAGDRQEWLRRECARFNLALVSGSGKSLGDNYWIVRWSRVGDVGLF